MFFQTQIGLCVVLCSQILQWCSIAFGKILWCALQVFGGHIIRRPSMIVCMHAKLLQSCITLYGCMDCSPPVSSVHGVLQARILEWVAIPSSRDLLNLGIKPVSPALLVASLLLSHQGSPSACVIKSKLISMLVKPATCPSTSFLNPCHAELSKFP